MNNSKRILMLMAVMLTLLLAFSCSSKKESSIEGYGGEGPEKSAPSAPLMMEESAPTVAPAPPAMDTTGTSTTVPESAVKKRKIIKTAEITIEVKDFNDSLKRVREILKEVAPGEQDGFIADSSTSKSDTGAMSGTVVIRVNPNKFDLLVEKLMEVGDVRYQRISGEDVTKEYYDMQARLAGKQEMEKRLLQLLATRTNSVSDLLEVERELGRVREEIESLQGSIRYYDDLVGMSTVNLTIQEPEAVVSGAGGFWEPIRKAIQESFGIFGKSIAALLIFIVGALPWAVVAYIVFLIVRRIVRKRRLKKEQAASAKATRK
jgi:hypothetical protein